MSVFDEKFDFRLARPDEVEKVMKFIRDYWPRKDHILGTDEALFRYEFFNNEKLCYYLAVDKETDEIMAGAGIYFYTKDFIPNQSDFSGGMILANPNCRVPFIGAEVLRRMTTTLHPRTYVAPGATYGTSGQIVLKVLKQKLTKMRQFYILSDRDTYKLAKIEEKRIARPESERQLPLKKYDTADEMYSEFDDIAFQSRRPYKDRWYITKRYFKHPIYQYQVYGAGSETAFVLKAVEENGARALRIIDILGDVNQIAFVGNALRELLEKGGYEYIDLYEMGMQTEALKAAGFVERTENDCNIIPNYFEPFVQQNIDIYVHHLSDDDLCFKGDGDQDRPNRR